MSASLLTQALDIAGYTCAIVCIFDSVRRIKVYGSSRKSIIYLSFGFLYCLGFAGASYWTHDFQLETSKMLHKGICVPELSENWGIDLSPQLRSKNSYLLAGLAFSEHGQLRYYFDESGRRLMFSPSQADINNREKKVAEFAKLDVAIDASSDLPARWMLVAIAAALLGLGWSSEKKDE